MRTEAVEIYSDATSAAVLRHPGRHFPGVLIQGDTLHNLCGSLGEVVAAARLKLDDDLIAELEDVRDQLNALLLHYKQTMVDHQLPLPFSELGDA